MGLHAAARLLVASLLIHASACSTRVSSDSQDAGAQPNGSNEGTRFDDDPQGDAEGEGEAEAEAEAEAEGEVDPPNCGGGDDGEEIDRGPNARPSNYPAAANWRDTPSSVFDPDEPCCELIGEPVELDGDHNAAGPPVADFNGACYGVAWGPVVFRALDASTDSVGDRLFFDTDSWVTALALEWGHDRYALAAGAWRGEWGKVAMLDREGTPLTEFSQVDEVDQPDIARHTHGHGWVLGYLDERGPEPEIRVRWVDDDASVGATDYRLGPGRDGHGPRMVGLKSRASAVWLQEGGVYHRSFRWPEVESAGPERLVLPFKWWAEIEAVAYRDETAVAAMTAGEVHVVLIDPWEDRIVAGPGVVGDSTIGDRRPGLVAVDERGYLGLCYAVGDGTIGGGGGANDGVLFSIVGPNARRWGAPVQIVDGLRNIGGCAVSWSGEDFLVAWWEAALPNNRILARRVRPRD